MKDKKLYGLVISDIHFGKKDDKRLFKELDEIFINKIRQEGSSIDFIEVAGDTFDRQIKMNEESGKLVSNFILTLNELSIEYDFQLRFLKGTLSHDFNQLELFRKLETSNPRFRIFNTVSVDVIDPVNEITVLQVPEEYVDDFDKHYKEYLELEDGAKYDFIFFHGTFDFAGYIANLSTTEKHMKNAPTFKEKQFSDLVYGACMGGHIHQCMEQGNVFYCGSFSRFGFGEEESKGFYELYYDFSDSLDVELNFIENNLAPTYATIDLDRLPDDIVEKTKALEELKSMYDFIRIKSSKSIDNEQDLTMLKKLSETDNNLKVEITKTIENEENKEYEFVTKREFDIPTTLQKYIEKKNNVKIDLKTIKEIISED